MPFSSEVADGFVLFFCRKLPTFAIGTCIDFVLIPTRTVNKTLYTEIGDNKISAEIHNECCGCCAAIPQIIVIVEISVVEFRNITRIGGDFYVRIVGFHRNLYLRGCVGTCCDSKRRKSTEKHCKQEKPR